MHFFDWFPNLFPYQGFITIVCSTLIAVVWWGKRPAKTKFEMANVGSFFTVVLTSVSVVQAIYMIDCSFRLYMIKQMGDFSIFLFIGSSVTLVVSLVAIRDQKPK